MEAHELRARYRKESGKGPARRLRKAGFVPAILYGRRREPLQLAVLSSDLAKLVSNREENVFINLIIGDEKKTENISIIKEIQVEPVSRRFLHVDFCEIDLTHEITVEVPIHLIGTPKGVENGGELHHLKRHVKVSALPASLPEYIEVDVTHLDIGDAIHIDDIVAAQGVTILDQGDTAIAMVTGQRVEVSPVPEEQETPIQES